MLVLYHHVPQFLIFVWGINPYKMKKPTLLLMMFSLLIIRAITVWRYPARYFRIVITATRQLVKVQFINKKTITKCNSCLKSCYNLSLNPIYYCHFC